MFPIPGVGGFQKPMLEPINSPKITRGHSCVLCFQRKVKCDGQRPCSACIRSRAECVTKAPSAPRRRRALISKGDLLARLKKCEKLLESHGVRVEEDGDAQKSTDQQMVHSTEQNWSPESPAEPGKLIVERGQARYIESDLWSELDDELRESHDLRQSSSDEYDDGSTLPAALYAGGDSLLFGRPMLESLRSSHPQPVQMFKLWQTFLDNVNPLVKILHAPTTQQLILEASGNLDNVSPSTEALMFAIYLSAVTSLRDDDCEKIMGISRHGLVVRFSNATQQALINAEILKTSNMVVLQAFTLFLLAMREHYEPTSTWLLAGLAVRIGQRIGLHRESASREVSVFEAEFRRRLWWQIIIMDFRSAELSGSKIELDSKYFHTSRPLNVNDSDLSPSMKEPPVEHPGITEMLFCSIRCEIGEFMRKYKSLKIFDAFGNRAAEIPLAEKDKAIDELEGNLERKYLRYSDVSIPLHFLSAALARTAVCQIRLLAHHPRQYADRGASLPQAEKDMLFSTSLQVIEYNNIGYTAESIRGYLWHVKVYLQLDSFIYLLSELRFRTEGDQVDRAWHTIGVVFENHPEIITNTKNLLFFTMGNLALKAWEKRSSAAGYNEHSLYLIGTPAFISRLRSHRKSNSSRDMKSFGDTMANELPQIGPASNMQVNYSGVDFLGLGTASEFDPSLQTNYAQMDTSPMDWEFWQGLLERSEWPMNN